MFYQPIFSNKDGFVYVYEALFRVKNGDFYIYPKELFSIAKEMGIDYKLDAICREQAIAQYQQKRFKAFYKHKSKLLQQQVFSKKRGIL
jgi:FOG: EAL domain